MSRYAGINMTHEEIMQAPSSEVLSECRMVNNEIKDYSIEKQMQDPDGLDDLLLYRLKLANVILEKMEGYDKMIKENGGIL